MSQQSHITRYFKSKLNDKSSIALKKMDERNNTSFTLPTSPAKPVKPDNKIINLVSSDDDCLSDSSNKTIIYTPPSPIKKVLSVPLVNSDTNTIVLSTTKKNKYYSPNKKHAVTNRSLKKVKRNLTSELTATNSAAVDKPNNIDDKTMFFLDMVQEYQNDPSMAYLLDENSHWLLTAYRLLPVRGLRLVCRLYWRREGWYKRSKLVEIMNNKAAEPTDDAVDEQLLRDLISQNFLVKGDAQNMNMQDFTTYLLQSDDLKNVCKQLKIKPQKKTKVAIHEALNSFCRSSSIASYFVGGKPSNNTRQVLQIMSEQTGPCYKLSDTCRTVFYKLHLLMYLGISYDIIRDKKLELMLLNVKSQRETFPVDPCMPIDKASLVFQTREHFENYLSAHYIYEEFIISKDRTRRCDILCQVYRLYKEISDNELNRYKSMPVWLRRFTPGYIYVKIMHDGIADMKRDKQRPQCELAVEVLDCLLNQELFRQHRRAEWYNEKALILHSYLQRSHKAAQVFLEGFSSHLCGDEDKDLMRRRAKTLAERKSLGLDSKVTEALLAHSTRDATLESSLPSIHVHKQPLENTTKRKILFETRTKNERVIESVEECALSHYFNTGEFTHGSHWEGRMVVTIFSLLFWDIIYGGPAQAKGVFLSRYQQLPLDMYTDHFYRNRKTLIDERLELIETSTIQSLLETMQTNWISRPDGELSLVHRDVGWHNAGAVARCLGAKRTAALCRRLATNYHYAHSGFPDLTLWNSETNMVKFVEVKSDSDNPSMKQIQWMQYLIANGIDTEFCYVGTKTHKKSRQKPSTKKLS